MINLKFSGEDLLENLGKHIYYRSFQHKWFEFQSYISLLLYLLTITQDQVPTENSQNNRTTGQPDREALGAILKKIKKNVL